MKKTDDMYPAMVHWRGAQAVSVGFLTAKDHMGFERPYRIVIVPLTFLFRPRPDVLHVDMWVTEYKDLIPDRFMDYIGYTHRVDTICDMIIDFMDTCKVGSNKAGDRNKFIPLTENSGDLTHLKAIMGESFYDVFARPTNLYDVATFINDANHFQGNELPFMKVSSRRLAREYKIDYPQDCVLRTRANAELYRKLMREIF